MHDRILFEYLVVVLFESVVPTDSAYLQINLEGNCVSMGWYTEFESATSCFTGRRSNQLS